jgi:hypothetical protein
MIKFFISDIISKMLTFHLFFIIFFNIRPTAAEIWQPRSKTRERETHSEGDSVCVGW